MPVLLVAMLLGGCGEGDDGNTPAGVAAERRLHPPGAETVTPEPAATPATPPSAPASVDPPPMTPPTAAPPVVTTPPVTVGPVSVPPVAVPVPNVDAKAIKADRLVADVVYVGDLHAQDARIAQPVEDDKEKRFEVPGADQHLEVATLEAVIVRAESIDVRSIEAKQVFARSIKIESAGGPGGMGMDKPKGKAGEGK
jgi:hypothetical protein